MSRRTAGGPAVPACPTGISIWHFRCFVSPASFRVSTREGCKEMPHLRRHYNAAPPHVKSLTARGLRRLAEKKGSGIISISATQGVGSYLRRPPVICSESAGRPHAGHEIHNILGTDGKKSPDPFNQRSQFNAAIRGSRAKAARSKASRWSGYAQIARAPLAPTWMRQRCCSNGSGRAKALQASTATFKPAARAD